MSHGTDSRREFLDVNDTALTEISVMNHLERIDNIFLVSYPSSEILIQNNGSFHMVLILLF